MDLEVIEFEETFPLFFTFRVLESTSFVAYPEYFCEGIISINSFESSSW
jgi:hypothetical protein